MAQPKIYTFEVMGRGELPWDMLRYDACWPVDGDAAAAMPRTDLRTIRFNSLQRPTVARWSSFLWGCKEIEDGQ